MIDLENYTVQNNPDGTVLLIPKEVATIENIIGIVRDDYGTEIKINTKVEAYKKMLYVAEYCNNCFKDIKSEQNYYYFILNKSSNIVGINFEPLNSIKHINITFTSKKSIDTAYRILGNGLIKLVLE